MMSDSKSGANQRWPVRTEAERFWSHVDKSDRCWFWTAALNRGGYGTFKVRRDGAWRQILAHRAAYELARGVIPDGLVLDHLCRVPRCVNPDHLEAVTLGENTRRGRAAEVARARQLLTHCKNGHEYIPANTSFNDGKRRCRACHRARQAEYLARKAGAAA